MPAATVALPRLTQCGCGAEVLEVQVRPRTFPAASASEVVRLNRTAIMPEHPCPDCVARRARGYDESTNDGCQRCNGRRKIGQRYPPDAVRVDEDGKARWLRGRPAEGDGVYEVHACGRSVAA